MGAGVLEDANHRAARAWSTRPLPVPGSSKVATNRNQSVSVDDLLTGFEFADDGNVSRSAAISMLMTPVLRGMICLLQDEIGRGLVGDRRHRWRWRRCTSSPSRKPEPAAVTYKT